jgi:hypothetical protein
MAAGSDGFQIVGVYFYRYALHNQVEREHYPQIVLLAEQYTFLTSHRTILDPYSFTDHEVGMRFDLV